MITVYRIEHKKKSRYTGLGYGPYNLGNSGISVEYDWHSKMLIKHSNSVSHPSLRLDLLKDKYEISNLYCGFLSIKDLKKWFRGFLTNLKKDDFIIKKYNVSKIEKSISGKQIFFDYKKILNVENI